MVGRPPRRDNKFGRQRSRSVSSPNKLKLNAQQLTTGTEPGAITNVFNCQDYLKKADKQTLFLENEGLKLLLCNNVDRSVDYAVHRIGNKINRNNCIRLSDIKDKITHSANIITDCLFDQRPNKLLCCLREKIKRKRITFRNI